MKGRFTSKVKSTDNLHNILKKITALTEWKAYAGFDEDAHEPSGMTLAELASIHEFGTEYIPERPFMTDAYHEDMTRSFEFKKIFTTTIYGRVTPKKAMKDLAKKMAGTIKLKIEMGEFTPLAKKTIGLKGHSRPLIDTFTLLEGVKAFVEKD